MIMCILKVGFLIWFYGVFIKNNYDYVFLFFSLVYIVICFIWN